jgi:hypothetical protein
MIHMCRCALWIGHTDDSSGGMRGDLIESDGEG